MKKTSLHLTVKLLQQSNDAFVIMSRRLRWISAIHLVLIRLY